MIKAWANMFPNRQKKGDKSPDLVGKGSTEPIDGEKRVVLFSGWYRRDSKGKPFMSVACDIKEEIFRDKRLLDGEKKATPAPESEPEEKLPDDFAF